MSKKSIETKYAKRKLFNKYLEMDEKINMIFSISNSCIERRISCLITNFKQQKFNLQDCNDDLNQHKELLKWINSQQSRDQLEKDEILQKVLQEPYSKEMSRVERLEEELNSYQNRQLKTPVKIEQKLSAFSPSSTPMKNAMMEKILSQSLNESLCTSDSSLDCPTTFIVPSIRFRMSEHHQWEEKSASFEICNDCLQKVSPLEPNDKRLHHCSSCGFHMHSSCLKLSLRRKLCIPVHKTTTSYSSGTAGASLRVTGERTVDMRDLLRYGDRRDASYWVNGCCMVPAVPSVLLLLMHHVHTFGHGHTNLYRNSTVVTGTHEFSKAAKELTEKLMKGKAKSISKFDIGTVCDCMKLLLGSLKDPLLSDDNINQFMMAASAGTTSSSITSSGNGTNFTDLLKHILSTRHRNKATIAYLLVHLKVVAGYRQEKCEKNVNELAKVFAPILISKEARVKHLSWAIELLEGLINVEYGIFINYITDFMLFQHVTRLMRDPDDSHEI